MYFCDKLCPSEENQTYQRYHQRLHTGVDQEPEIQSLLKAHPPQGLDPRRPIDLTNEPSITDPLSDQVALGVVYATALVAVTVSLWVNTLPGGCGWAPNDLLVHYLNVVRSSVRWLPDVWTSKCPMKGQETVVFQLFQRPVVSFNFQTIFFNQTTSNYRVKGLFTASHSQACRRAFTDGETTDPPTLTFPNGLML